MLQGCDGLSLRGLGREPRAGEVVFHGLEARATTAKMAVPREAPATGGRLFSKNRFTSNKVSELIMNKDSNSFGFNAALPWRGHSTMRSIA